jgi:hypothetical protein
MLYYLINKYKADRRIILKFSLKVILGIFYSLTKEVKHLGFFKEKIVVVNIEFSLYLDPPIFKSRVYPVRQWLGVKEFNRF